MGGHGNKVTKGFFLKAKYSILHYFLPKFDVKNVENMQNSQKLYNLLCSKKKKIWTSGLVTISPGQTGQIWTPGCPQINQEEMGFVVRKSTFVHIQLAKISIILCI